MNLPKQITIEDGHYTLDGGTIHLIVYDECSRKHDIVLVQHLFSEYREPDCIPGRLYFDNQLVDLRSPDEARILQLLHYATVSVSSTRSSCEDTVSVAGRLILGDDIREAIEGDSQTNLHRWRTSIVAFVSSDEYVSFAPSVHRIS
jgi:hypothetical protein